MLSKEDFTRVLSAKLVDVMVGIVPSPFEYHNAAYSLYVEEHKKSAIEGGKEVAKFFQKKLFPDKEQREELFLNSAVEMPSEFVAEVFQECLNDIELSEEGDIKSNHEG